MKKLNKLLKGLVLVLPAVLFFSYFPVIGLGANESMNFEFSLPLIWLVIFDVVGLVALWKRKILIKGLKEKWTWLLFPVWISLSVLWSLNFVRGLLTVGIVWLLYLAGYAMWSLRDLFDNEFRVKFLKWLFGSTLVVCGWCLLQCVLDILGVSQGWTLLCDGCTYHMFGFPHPNGFAIEPQFMGNLLLAPAIVCAWMMTKRKNSGSGSLGFGTLLICFLIITSTLFLTFSRGAIYAFVVGMLFLSGFLVFREKKSERFLIMKRLGMVWGMLILSFLFTLNLQGMMAAVSPTNDTYFSGISKVVNQLTLGVIDIRGGDGAKTGADVSEENEALESGRGLQGDTMKNEGETEKVLQDDVMKGEKETESVFDGYVEESTGTRVRLNDAAIQIWSKNLKNAMLGVGLGGAGQALYNDGLSPAPKEIIQNEYFSLLLETGVVGVALGVLMAALFIRKVIRGKNAGMVLALMVAYGVSLMFFSGLPNALHIYLLMVFLFAFC